MPRDSCPTKRVSSGCGTRNEISAICPGTFTGEEPPGTRRFALRAIRAKELNECNGVLRRTVAYLIVQAQSIAASREGQKAKGRNCLERYKWSTRLRKSGRRLAEYSVIR